MAELLCVRELNSDLNPYPTLTLILVLTALVTRQAPLSMGFSRQKYCTGLPFPPPGDLPDPGMELGSPAFQSGSLPSEPPGKPTLILTNPDPDPNPNPNPDPDPNPNPDPDPNPNPKP